MQSNDDLYSTDTNPILASYRGDDDQSVITTPVESDKDSKEMMPIAGANETSTDDENEGTDNEENASDEQDAADAEDVQEEDVDDADFGTNEDTVADDTNADTDDDDDDDEEESTGTALNKSMSATSVDDKGGIY